ncbi:MAG TPA: serine/threonine-protein kinase [Kofleriaceae bacterium]|nr:serine/threonine-protein kinase [Kofleriaceae bacterium]
MAVLPGKTLERYELLNRIAVGGMAEVYRSVAYGAHGFEKTLAIKRILPELAQDPEFEARFIAEAKLAVKLTHANVVQIFDFGRFSGSLFIAMEFVDGLDLAALLKVTREAGGRIPIPAAFQIGIEIARGLDFAHQQRVVHRDVSPSNILLSRAGEVKIADFGIAQAVKENKRKAPGRRRIMGKWRYMSPEQTTGEDLSTSSDVFSAASVLFELFTGDKLFPGDDADEIIRNIREMPIPSVAERRPGLPPRLDDILRRCLQRDPDARPGKPGEVVRALTEVSYESSIVATALDVAEAVRDAVATQAETDDGAADADGAAESRRKAGLDELIRKQLGGAVAGGGTRRTAVTHRDGPADATAGKEPTHTATVVKKGVDADGLTLWDFDLDEEREDTIAAGPSAIKHGRTTGQVRALGEATTDHLETTGDKSVVQVVSRLPWKLIAAAAIGGAVVAAWMMTRGGSSASIERPVAAVATDAAPAGPVVTTATLAIDSVPAGARVWVDGAELPTPTPTAAVVTSGEPHRIDLEADGFARWSLMDVRVEPGKTLPIKPTLVAIRASLSVITDPAGAEVELNGAALGLSPIERDDLAPGRGVLVIRKKGYQRLRESVELAVARPVAIERTLEPIVVYGSIRVAVPGWADVYLRGKKIGTVPRQALRLPVGTHRLRLHNPTTNQEHWLDAEVVSSEQRVYKVTW